LREPGTLCIQHTHLHPPPLHHIVPVQEPAATTQVYSLCDMAVSTVQGLAGAMRLALAELPQYDGGIILPRGLYRALDKADRGEPRPQGTGQCSELSADCRSTARNNSPGQI
jgi:hypothetical protein